MTDLKPQIDKLVCENVTRTGRKVQLYLRTELSKPTKGEETELFLRSAMVPMYGNSLPQADFLGAVDKMFNTLSAFTTSESGWHLEEILELDIKLAFFNPIRASSYLLTPPELDTSRLLINIRNPQDQNCFLNCFAAAWHLKCGPLLYVTGRDTFRNRTSPQTFSRSNPLAHQQKASLICLWGWADASIRKTE